MLGAVSLATFSITSAWASPSGAYLVGEAGVIIVTKGKLKGIQGINHGNQIVTNPLKENGTPVTERLAVGSYFMHPDSLTAVGVELTRTSTGQSAAKT